MTYDGTLGVLLTVGGAAAALTAVAKVGLVRNSRKLADRLRAEEAERLPHAFEGTVTAIRERISADARFTFHEITILRDDGTTVVYNITPAHYYRVTVGSRVSKVAGKYGLVTKT
jgi:hypothetical protein